MKKYYLDSDDLLKNLVDNIYKQKILAIDTEFIRRNTYYPILSLIQIRVEKEVYAIDCMKNVDLNPIFEIMTNPEIRKIFHSCSQDLQIFHQKIGQKSQNIVDIQLMANFCGIGYNVGYSSLVRQFKGVEIDKKLQNSNWQKRPLTEKQIEYALLDVVYLEEIYQELLQYLQKNGREKWFFEDMKNVVENIDKSNELNLVKNFVRNKRSYSGNMDKLNKINELILWREKLAQKKDLPRQHLISDESLEDLMRGKMVDLQIEENEFLEAQNILNSSKTSDFKLDFDITNFIMNESQKIQYESAKSLIAKIASELEVKEQFLVSAPSLKDMILQRKKPKEMLNNWRYFLFGQKIEKLIS